MIIFENGHYRSIRTPEEEAGLFQKDLEGLTPEEREVVMDILRSADSQKLVSALAESEYERIPVDMHTFIYDEYYMGNTCSGIYPQWAKDLEEIFSGGYGEIIFTGAIGIGKCVSGDTEVFDHLSGKRVTVREVADSGKELRVQSLADDGSLVISPARAFRSGKKKCVRLYLDDGSSITLSTDHPVLTSRGWVKAGELTPNDLVATVNKVLSPEIPRLVPDDILDQVAGLLSSEDSLKVPYRLPPEFFGMPDSRVSKFLGRLSTYPSSEGSYRILEVSTQSLARDLKYLFARIGYRSAFYPTKASKGKPAHYRLFIYLDESREESPFYWERVLSTVPVGTLPVYDLTVDIGHNFIGNGIVVHNTFVASVGICRLLYELSCLRDPHSSLGIARDTNISIVGFSVNEELAMKVVLENIATKISASPYFQENFPFQVTKKELRFPKNVWVAARASTDTSALGLNVIGAILDEANFQQKTKSKSRLGKPIDRAQVLYTQIRRRMKSRFERNGKTPGKLFLLSSKDSTSDFTEKRIQESMTDPSVFVRDYPLWGPKPRDHFSEETFFVLVGNEHVLSKILTEEEKKTFDEEGVPEGCIIVEVPENFRVDFEQDLEGSIRDIAGIATVAVSPFIQRRDKILEMVDETIPRAFDKDTLNPEIGGRFLWPNIVKKQEERLPGGVYEIVDKPIFHPNEYRHIHIDIGLTSDSLGLVMAHRFGERTVTRKLPDGREVTDTAPVFWADLVLEVVPPTGGEIFLQDIKAMILMLVEKGFVISKATCDSYQSFNLIQDLNRAGIPAEVLSVDKSLDPYVTLKTAIYEGRVRTPHHEKLIRELQTIQLDRTKAGKPKVDHPPNGSKDVADALAGVVYTLSQGRRGGPMPIIVGSGNISEDPGSNSSPPPILFG